MTCHVWFCAVTIPDVDIVPAKTNTATIDRPIATSYEIICAAERSPPSSGYVEPDAQPDSTMPYTPSDEHANTTSTPTGRSVSCNGVWCPNSDTIGPNGMTENARNAGTADRIGARKYTGLSASTGMISSLNASLTPSASDCSVPHGPTRLGPMRFCMRPTTLRS